MTDAQGLPPVCTEDAGLYVHFPFCVSKCHYCDFNSHVSDHDDDAYADVVIRELTLRAEQWRAPRPLRTLFFGGGTPSLWTPSALGRVIEASARLFGHADAIEISMEANPGSSDASRFADYAAAGVTRFSIGCQSFVDDELRWLERAHGAAEAVGAVEAAQATGARVSLDLMYGLPDQPWANVERSFAQAEALQVDHVSAYALTVEPRTALSRRVALRVVTPMDDDEQADLYARTTDRLGSMGLARYEVSSYARTGQECLHNLLYWLGGTYLAAGAGAHGFVDGRRYANLRNPGAYGAGRFTPPADLPDPREHLAERFTVGFRSRWGIEAALVASEPALVDAADELMARGLIRRWGARLAPTESGYAFVDGIAIRFLEALDRSPR